MSLVLQSGNFGIDLNFNAKKRGMGYSCWATIGNQMDVRFNDFVRYIEQDDHTKVMLLYMEGLRVENEEDGRKFLEAARRTSVSKPIAAIKNRPQCRRSPRRFAHRFPRWQRKDF